MLFSYQFYKKKVLIRRSAMVQESSFLVSLLFVLNLQYFQRNFQVPPSWKMDLGRDNLKIHLHNRNTCSSKFHMFIAEGFYNINCGKILPHKLSKYPIAFTMQYPKIAMLHNKCIINKVPDLINGLFSPDTTNIDFRLKINIALNQTRIIFPENLISLKALFQVRSGYSLNFVERDKKSQATCFNLNHFIFYLNYLTCGLSINHPDGISGFKRMYVGRRRYMFFLYSFRLKFNSFCSLTQYGNLLFRFSL